MNNFFYFYSLGIVLGNIRGTVCSITRRYRIKGGQKEDTEEVGNEEFKKLANS